MALTTLFSVLLVLCVIGYASAADYYVKVGGSGSGTSWSDALGVIQDAVDLCSSGSDTIHVAKGTYDNSTGETFPITFSNKSGIRMLGYGGSHSGPWIRGDGKNRVIEVLHSHNITIENFKVSDGRSSGDGGGILVYGTEGDQSTDIVLFDLEVTENSCAGNGGGMAWHQSCGLIEKSCIWNNKADGDYGGGGGIFLSWPAASDSYEGYTVRDCCIFWNSATLYGGGILLAGDDQHSEIVNNLIRQNCIYTENEAAGIQSICAKVYVKHNTVADNYHGDDCMPTWGKCATGGSPQYPVYGIKGCDQYGYWMRMIHNIVYFNGPASFNDINISSNTIFVRYSDVQMNSPSPYPGEGNIDVDPQFEGNKDDERRCNSTFYFLASTSPCIDAGIAAYQDEWEQTHCELVNTQSCAKETDYSVLADGSEDLDFWCQSDQSCRPGDESYRIDLGYHYDWHGMNYIKLLSFTARAFADRVVVKWETATEIDNAGFLVYRCDNLSSQCSKVSDFVPAKGEAATGASYLFIDRDVESGSTYYYYLVDVDTHGSWSVHGPVSVTVPVKLLSPRFVAPRQAGELALQ